MAVINVTKASGDLEPYNESKLRHSLKSAGAGKDVVDSIAKIIRSMLYEGVSTQEIYKEAFRLLRQYSDRSAGRYKLKEAILELGPTGYPFERFVGELLNRLGYKTKVGVIVDGKCVSHEVDVIAEKDDEHFMVECKFHNTKSRKCNVRIPLYIHSRFKDVERTWRKRKGHGQKTHRGWVVTNTRFTKDAQQYGACAGLKLLSWDYPKHEGLKDMINRVNLHPVTSLSTLSKKEKQALLEEDVVFCLQLCEDEKNLNPLRLDKRERSRVLKEAQAICNLGL